MVNFCLTTNRIILLWFFTAVFGMKDIRRIRSESIIPLFYDDRFIGSLNLGSNDPLRYEDGAATDYIKRLAQLLSLAFSNIYLKSSPVKT